MNNKEIIDNIIKSFPDGIRTPDELYESLFGGFVAVWHTERCQGIQNNLVIIGVHQNGSVYSSLIPRMFPEFLPLEDFMKLLEGEFIKSVLKKYCRHKEG